MKIFCNARILAAAALMSSAAPDAKAQGDSYCNGRLRAASFYSTLQNSPGSSVVRYYMILQNMKGENLNFAVTFQDNRVASRPDGTVFNRLGPWGTSPALLLGVARLNNPYGTGGLDVPQDLAAATRVICR